jgi:hypothetical protein
MTSSPVQPLHRLDACAVDYAPARLGLTGAVTGVPHRSGPARIAGAATLDSHGWR